MAGDDTMLPAWEDKPELALASMPVEILVKIMSDAIPSHRLLCTQSTKEDETGSYLATKWVDIEARLQLLNKKIHDIVLPILDLRRRVIHPTLLQVFTIEKLRDMEEDELDDQEIRTKCNAMRLGREDSEERQRPSQTPRISLGRTLRRYLGR
ncbi:uncharacterized protein AB675_7501 [Cyphellophora attinorum]|uniref:Uncharacterized protein n=1 Tax=Cyphellophora attinorum TaxID=1664694 RepID=A0A0N1NYJ7_9EURO|nr:uncharacterized protein AB675_7501 [Phialophora attinorum]KPI40283.1 hypothetical protein AB675_7501 [Phialophora attinorum]